MSDNLNIKLLKQHAAILETVLQTVNNVSKSITEEAAALDAELAPVRTCALSWPVVTLAGCVPSSALLVRATANPCGVERLVLICDFERTVPALLSQPGDRDGQKAPP